MKPLPRATKLYGVGKERRPNNVYIIRVQFHPHTPARLPSAGKLLPFLQTFASYHVLFAEARKKTRSTEACSHRMLADNIWYRYTPTVSDVHSRSLQLDGRRCTKARRGVHYRSMHAGLRGKRPFSTRMYIGDMQRTRATAARSIVSSPSLTERRLCRLFPPKHGRPNITRPTYRSRPIATYLL